MLGDGCLTANLVYLIQQGLTHKTNSSSRKSGLVQDLAAQVFKENLPHQSLQLLPPVKEEITDQLLPTYWPPPLTAALQMALNSRESLPTDLNHLPRFTTVEPSS